MATLDELLMEFEKSTYGATRGRARKDFKFDYEKYDFIGSFNGACTRKLKTHSIGTYNWVVVNSKGAVVEEDSNEV